MFLASYSQSHPDVWFVLAGVVDFDWYFGVLHSALTGAVCTLVSVNLYGLIWGDHSRQVWDEGLRFGANAGSIGLGRVMGEFGNVS